MSRITGRNTMAVYARRHRSGECSTRQDLVVAAQELYELPRGAAKLRRPVLHRTLRVCTASECRQKRRQEQWPQPNALHINLLGKFRAMHGRAVSDSLADVKRCGTPRHGVLVCPAPIARAIVLRFRRPVTNPGTSGSPPAVPGQAHCSMWAPRRRCE